MYDNLDPYMRGDSSISGLWHLHVKNGREHDRNSFKSRLVDHCIIQRMNKPALLDPAGQMN
jgi:hypothetical protein